MTEKKDTGTKLRDVAANTKPVETSASPATVLETKYTSQGMPYELLERAAALLEEQEGPRTNKFYRSLAGDVRAIAARLAE